MGFDLTILILPRHGGAKLQEIHFNVDTLRLGFVWYYTNAVDFFSYKLARVFECAKAKE